MGVCLSKQKVYAFEVNPSKVGHEQDTYDLCHTFLDLNDQGVDKFYQLFKKIDKIRCSFLLFRQKSMISVILSLFFKENR